MNAAATAALEKLGERARADVALEALPLLTDQAIHLVGGVVRDALRGDAAGHAGQAPYDENRDWDIVVASDAVGLARRFADAVGGSFVHLHDAQPTARVVIGAAQYDFAQYRAPTLADDLRARDFTVNAIATDLRALLRGDISLEDPCGGGADLAARRLQPCGVTVFADDPLRALRLYRFVATLGFAPSAEAEEQAAATARSGAITGVATERVVAELASLCAGRDAANALGGLARSGVWEAVVPEATATHGLRQSANHHLDVFDHNLAAAQTVAGEFLPTLDAWAGAWAGDLREWLAAPVARGRARQWLVPFAAMLHDIAKPATRTTKPDGTPAFDDHEKAGGAMAMRIGERLRLSHSEVRLLRAFVRFHAYPIDTLPHHDVSHMLRLLAICGDAAPGVVLVAMGDRATARGPARPPEIVRRDVAYLQGIVREYFGIYAPLFASPPLVRGDDIMRELGIPAGKWVGTLLFLLRAQQLRGAITTPAEAFAAARTFTATYARA